MGLCGSKSSTRAIKVVKIFKRPVENDSKTFQNTQKIQIKKLSIEKHRKQNYFYEIQKYTWKIIIDFLPYKDLHQVGRVNKYFKNTSKKQEILKKFYKNNGICIIASPLVNINIYNNTMNVIPNKNKKNLYVAAPLKSFPTFKNHEDENELDNSLDIKNNQKFSSIMKINSSIYSRNKSKNEKSESELDREYNLDHTPSFSQEFDLSIVEIESSFKILT